MHMADLPTPPRYQLPNDLSATNHRHVQPKLTPPIGCFPELLDMTKIAQFALVRHSKFDDTYSELSGDNIYHDQSSPHQTCKMLPLRLTPSDSDRPRKPSEVSNLDVIEVGSDQRPWTLRYSSLIRHAHVELH